METIKLLTLDGYTEIRAESFGLFYVHRALIKTGVSNQSWSVTHATTGRAIARFKVRALAKETAKVFDALFEMYRVEDDLKSWLRSAAFCQLGNVILDGLDRVEEDYSNRDAFKKEQERWMNDESRN